MLRAADGSVRQGHAGQRLVRVDRDRRVEHVGGHRVLAARASRAVPVGRAGGHLVAVRGVRAAAAERPVAEAEPVPRWCCRRSSAAVTTPVPSPWVAEPRNASVWVPDGAFTVTVCPAGIVLSGKPGVGCGQVKVTPFTVAVCPAVSPAAASACAE